MKEKVIKNALNHYLHSLLVHCPDRSTFMSCIIFRCAKLFPLVFTCISSSWWMFPRGKTRRKQPGKLYESRENFNLPESKLLLSEIMKILACVSGNFCSVSFQPSARKQQELLNALLHGSAVKGFKSSASAASLQLFTEALTEASNSLEWKSFSFGSSMLESIKRSR